MDDAQSATARQLIVINGPVASGKTTVSRALAAWSRQHGQTAAAVDVDDIVEMIAGQDWSTVTHGKFQRARRITAGLVDSLFESGIDLVVLAGPFFTPEARDEMLHYLHSTPCIRFVTLKVSFDEAFHRAINDPDPERVHTRDRDFLARLYDSIDWHRLPEGDLIIDTDGIDADEVTARVVQALNLP